VRPEEARSRERRTILDHRRAAIAAFPLSFVLSCSHSTVVRPAPSYDVLVFQAPLPAAAAVFVDSDGLRREVHLGPAATDGYGWCQDSRYPVDAGEALELSVIGTLEQLTDEVRRTATPLDRETMESRGFDAVIVVRTDTFDARVAGDPFSGFSGSAELTLAVSAFTSDGLLLREIVYGSGVHAAGGMTCKGGAEAVGLAVEVAIESAMTQLGEVIVSSQELRSSLADREFRRWRGLPACSPRTESRIGP